MSILIQNATLLTVDPENKIIRNGALLVEQDKIIALGDIDTVKSQTAHPEHTIDARNCFLLPGLVDAHIHTGNTLSRGLIPHDVVLADWLAEWMVPFKSVLDQDDGKTSAQLVMLEMIQTGTTCFLDTLLYSRHGLEGVVNAVLESGMRACIAKFVTDSPRLETKKGAGEEDTLGQAKSFFKRFNGAGDGKIDIWLEPPHLGRSQPTFYQDASALAKELDTGMTIHFMEGPKDREPLQKMGISPGQFAKKVGLLGERRVYAHGVWISDEDIDILAEGKVSIAHCPTTNMKVIDGIAPIPRMIRKNVNVALGCDGFSSNDNVDIFREMRTAPLLHNVVNADPTAVSVKDALRMGTINGARALGKANKIGSLEVGKKADLITVEMRRPYTSAERDPLGHVIYSCSGSNVRDVIVDGKIIMLNRQILSLNVDEIHQEVEKRAQLVSAKFDARKSR